MPQTSDRTSYLEQALVWLDDALRQHGPACLCRGHEVLWHAEEELERVRLVMAVAQEAASCGSRRWREVLGEG